MGETASFAIHQILDGEAGRPKVAVAEIGFAAEAERSVVPLLAVSNERTRLSFV